jgi:SAM-dependent methyltransferase
MSAAETGVVGAYQHWDEQWRRADGIAAWAHPDPDVIAVGSELLAAGGRRCLDVGCGIGRHALALAELGFEAHAIDRSEAGLQRVRAEAARCGLNVTTRMTDMTSLPYPDESFDFAIAWNVIYHGTPEDAVGAATEIARVLRPGGRYLSTMLSKHNTQYGKGEQIAPDVFVDHDGPEDKAHPHLYTDMADVLRLHPELRLISAADREHGSPGSYHWHLVFEKPLASGLEKTIST